MPQLGCASPITHVWYSLAMAKGACKAIGCNNNGRLARGWCISCYNWARSHDWADPDTRTRRDKSPDDGECTVVVDGVKCNRPSRGHKMCETHNRNRRVHGDPLKLVKTGNGVARKLLEDAAYTDSIVCIPFHRGGANTAVNLGGGRYTPASRAVWTIRYGNPGDLFVLHKCNGGSGDNGCININHLYLGDHTRNMHDRSAAMRQVVEDHHNAKLTNGQALSIIERFKRGSTARELASEYGVHPETVWDIVSGRTWKLLPGRD